MSLLCSITAVEGLASNSTLLPYFQVKESLRLLLSSFGDLFSANTFSLSVSLVPYPIASAWPQRF